MTMVGFASLCPPYAAMRLRSTGRLLMRLDGAEHWSRRRVRPARGAAGMRPVGRQARDGLSADPRRWRSAQGSPKGRRLGERLLATFLRREK